MKLRTPLFLIAVVAMISLWSLAAKAEQKKDESRGKTTVTGCLSKGDEPNEFYLTSDNGKRYELRSDNVALGDHVDHKITVTGTPSKESEETEEREGGRHNEAAEHNAGNLQVTNVKMVSTSCK